MIVKYARERGYKGQGKDPSVSLGKKYLAFGIDFRPNSLEYPPLVIIWTDSEQNLAMFELSLFEIIVESVPTDWVFHDLGEGYLRLTPKEFLGEFWDQFNDGDENAEHISRSVRKKLEDFHSLKVSALHSPKIRK